VSYDQAIQLITAIESDRYQPTDIAELEKQWVAYA